MSKILASLAAFALLIMLALPAGAAERRADGLRANDPAAQTEFSSRYRGWHRRHFVRRGWWGPRYGYYPRWRHRYAYYPYYRPYWRPWYRPWRPYPVVGIGFGYGRRWWW